MMNRRQFGILLGSSAAAPMLAAPVYAQAKARVVVIGGGPGGATAAKYIAKESGSAIEVTLVEPTKQFTTCFHSNLYLGGFKPLEAITHTYDKLASSYGIKLNHQAAVAIDRDKKQVRLADGSMLPYDRLVLSPGIDLKYDSVPGWGQEHEEAMPHAWKAGKQTAAPEGTPRCRSGWWPHRHDRAAQSLSLPAGTLRARLDDGARAQGGRQDKGEDRHHRPKGGLLQAAPVHGGLDEALPGHGRVARPEDPRGRQVGRSQDQHGRHRLRDLQGGAGQRHSGADGGQDRARCRLGQPERVLPDRSDQHEVDERSQHLRRRRCLHSRRHAEVGVCRQQPGQGRGHDGARRAGQGTDVPGALCQYLLEPDRDRRHGEDRRSLRGKGRQDRADRHVRLQDLARPRHCAKKPSRRTSAGTRGSLPTSSVEFIPNSDHQSRVR